MVEQEPHPRLYERVPRELRDYPQWVVWRRREQRKVPVNPATLGNAGVGWPNTWVSFERAVEVATGCGLGLGFVLTEEDPYTCVDLDGCIDREGQVTGTARAILDLLGGWTELSPSEMGLHIWVRNEEPINRRTKGIEVYSHARWMTVTGRSNPQASPEIPERTGEVQELLRRYFPEARPALVAPALDCAEDHALWEHLFASQHGAFFRSLFAGDTSVCYGDHSRGVILLANALVALTGGDAARVKRLLYQTGLVREKWEEPRGSMSWIEYQIEDALQFVARRRR
jgi:putative DNA primase/helicase